MIWSAIHERVLLAQRESQKCKEPAKKERRQYLVTIAPFIFLAILTSAGHFVGLAGLDGVLPENVGSLQSVSTDVMTISRLLEHLNCALSLTAFSVLGEPIGIRLSGRSMSRNLGVGTHSVRDAWCYALGPVARLGAQAISLPTLFQRLGRGDLAAVMMVPWQQQPFFLDLIQMVLESGDHPLAPSARFTAFTRTWPDRALPLHLYTKSYLARGDERAYVSDSDAFRSLGGSILQAALMPSSITARLRLTTNDVNPATSRNILKKIYNVPSGKSLYLTMSDTSSFTSSGVNLWGVALAHLTMLTQSQEGERWCRPFMVRVYGHFLEVTMVELLQLYLYMTVGVPCIDTEAGEEYVSQGGYLGVAANMTLCLLAQSLVLLCLKNHALQRGVIMDAQTGGDDVFTALIGDDADVYLVVGKVRSDLTSFVGSQKEFGYMSIDVSSEREFTLPYTFCKKAVTVRVKPYATGCFVEVMSEYELPLMEGLFSPLPENADLERELFVFSKSVSEAVSRYSNPNAAYHALMSLYIDVHDFPLGSKPLVMKQTNVCVPDDLITQGDLVYTKHAYEVVYAQPWIEGPNTCAHETLMGKTQYALSMRYISLVRTDAVMFYVGKREMKRVLRTGRVPVILLPPLGEESEMCKVLELVNSMR